MASNNGQLLAIDAVNKKDIEKLREVLQIEGIDINERDYVRYFMFLKRNLYQVNYDDKYRLYLAWLVSSSYCG